MKKPDPDDMAVGGAAPSLSSPLPLPPGAWPLGTMSKGKFSKPGMERRVLASTLEVTSMETTAGDTLSKMSAKDSGEPGGGAKIGAVEARISWGGSPLSMAGRQCIPAPASAAPAMPTPASAPTI